MFVQKFMVRNALLFIDTTLRMNKRFAEEKMHFNSKLAEFIFVDIDDDDRIEKKTYK